MQLKEKKTAVVSAAGREEIFFAFLGGQEIQIRGKSGGFDSYVVMQNRSFSVALLRLRFCILFIVLGVF